MSEAVFSAAMLPLCIAAMIAGMFAVVWKLSVESGMKGRNRAFLFVTLTGGLVSFLAHAALAEFWLSCPRVS